MKCSFFVWILFTSCLVFFMGENWRRAIYKCDLGDNFWFDHYYTPSTPSSMSRASKKRPFSVTLKVYDICMRMHFVSTLFPQLFNTVQLGGGGKITIWSASVHVQTQSKAETDEAGQAGRSVTLKTCRKIVQMLIINIVGLLWSRDSEWNALIGIKNQIY